MATDREPARATQDARSVTLGELIRLRASADPAGTYLESARDERVVTWAGLARAARGWSDRLDASAVPRGSRVSLLVADPLRFATSFVSIIAAGRVVAPLNPDADEAAVERHVAGARPAVIVDVDPSRPARGADDVSDTELSGRWARLDPVPAPPPASDARAGGLLLTSSGTTGTPKVVQLREAQLVHTATQIARHHGLRGTDRGFNPLPLWHVNAEVVGLLATLVAGSQLVLDDRFHRTGFWKLLADREITWLNAVPAVLAILAAQRPDPAPPPTLRFARSASAPLPVPTLHAFERATGVLVVETYGMTEAGSQITANPVGPDRRPGSVGQPVGVSLQVVDDDGHPAATGTTGRVRIRGAGVITAYAGAAGGDQFTGDGWLDTGDLGRLDSDGFLHLAGRRDDIINRGGEKLVPTVIERVLAEDPEVAAVAVVGWPDPVLGAVPVAAVVATPGLGEPGAAALATRLHRLAARRLDRTHRPAAYHLLEELPAGVNGKVSRRAVRERLVELIGPDSVPGDDRR